MKRFFRSLLIVIAVVLGTPLTVLGIMYDGSGEELMPVHLYTEDADSESMMLTELDQSLTTLLESNDSDLVINITEDMINTIIFETIREEINPDYMPTSGCADDACMYIVSDFADVSGDMGVQYRAVGAWVEFEDDTIALKTFIEVEADNIPAYKTVIELRFTFQDLPNQYVFAYESLYIGGMPIPASLITGTMDQLDQTTDEAVQLGTLDLDNLSYTITKQEIIDQVVAEGETEGDEASAIFAKELLSIIFDNALFVLDINETAFSINARISQLKNADDVALPEYLIGFDYESFDAENYLQNQFTEYVFNMALTNQNFAISEEVLNKLMYVESMGYTDMQGVMTYPTTDGVDKEIEYGVEGMWFEIEADAIYVKLLATFGDVKSVMTLKADVNSDNDQELVFTFSEITFGYDEGEGENDYLLVDDVSGFKQMLASLGDVEFGTFNENGDLVVTAEGLEAVMTEGTNEGVISVDGIFVVDGALELEISPSDAALNETLTAIQNQISSVIESGDLANELATVFDITNDGDEKDVYDAVVDLQATIATDPDSVTPEQVQALFSEIDDLDQEAQDAFADALIGVIDESIFDTFDDEFFNGSFNSDTTE
jgi:hypothetical protein